MFAVNMSVAVQMIDCRNISEMTLCIKLDIEPCSFILLHISTPVLMPSIDIGILFIRPSVTICYCIEYHPTPFSIRYPLILVFPVLNICAQYRWGHPYGGIEYSWGIQIS